MGSALSERQKDELYVEVPDVRHKALLEYLHVAGFTSTYDALKAESKLTDYEPHSQSRYAGLLEKKWLSTIRLQKKVCSSTYQDHGLDVQSVLA